MGRWLKSTLALRGSVNFSFKALLGGSGGLKFNLTMKLKVPRPSWLKLNDFDWSFPGDTIEKQHSYLLCLCWNILLSICVLRRPEWWHDHELCPWSYSFTQLNITRGKRRRRKQNTFLYKIVFLLRKGFFIIQQSAVWENFCSSSTFVCVYPNPNSFNAICIASCSFRGLSTKITFENADRKQGLFLHCTVAASWSWQNSEHSLSLLLFHQNKGPVNIQNFLLRVRI